MTKPLTKYQKIENAIRSYAGSPPIWVDWITEADVVDEVALILKLPPNDEVALHPLFITALKSRLKQEESREDSKIDYRAVCKIIKEMIEGLEDKHKIVNIERHKQKGVVY